jgi:aminoglycoside phosphotransferase (APT) family kinase protein
MTGDVRDLLARHLPDYAVVTIAPLGSGLEHEALEINGELVVRTARAGVTAEHEARVLAAVAPLSPVPVPEPLVADGEAMVYRKLPGVPLTELPRARARGAIGVLEHLLMALHAVPLEQVELLVDRDDVPLDEWLRETAVTYERVGGVVPARDRPAIEAFLARAPPPPAPALAFSHNDLGAEHVLADPASGAVTGVIDWSDAAITDPAYDHGLLWRDLGAEPPAAMRERARFFARCAAIEDLAFGLETGRERYTSRSLGAIPRIFGGRR